MEFGTENSPTRQQQNPLREKFIHWQCRAREISMRDHQGRPDDAIKPYLILDGETQELGQIITVLSRLRLYSQTPEMMHLVKSKVDPAACQEAALQLFSENYYQKSFQFSDVLTAGFPPSSTLAKLICDKMNCQLIFEYYSQRFELVCKATKIRKDDHLFQATWWHNRIFNPHLNPETIIIGFEPNWKASKANAI